MASKLSAEGLVELDRLERAATPGPWPDVQTNDIYDGVSDGELADVIGVRFNGSRATKLADTVRIGEHKFIAATRNAIRPLLDEIQESRLEIDRLRKMVGEAKCSKHDELFVARCIKCEREERDKVKLDQLITGTGMICERCGKRIDPRKMRLTESGIEVEGHNCDSEAGA